MYRAFAFALAIALTLGTWFAFNWLLRYTWQWQSPLASVADWLSPWNPLGWIFGLLILLAWYGLLLRLRRKEPDSNIREL